MMSATWLGTLSRGDLTSSKSQLVITL
ncbi:hypothetical protein RSAG8_03780, partial [Rhizoctonia solani AG-8 WAC10335]